MDIGGITSDGMNGMGARDTRQLVRDLFRRLRFVMFETKVVKWNVRDCQVLFAEIRPDMPVQVDFSNSAETREWVRGLGISELMDKRDEELAVKEGHYWGNARCRGRIIGCIKVCFNRVYIPDFRKIVRLPDGVVYVTDCYLVPEWRGRGVGPYLIWRACELAKRQGFRKAMSFNEPWNRSARRSSEKVRIDRTERIRYVRLFGMKLFVPNPLKF